MKNELPKEIDLHRFSIEDAQVKILGIVNIVRQLGIEHEVSFITGRGVLQDAGVEALNDFNIEYSIPLHNKGRVVAMVE